MALYAVIGSTEHNLEDGSLGLLVGHDGWGLPPMNRFMSRAHAQHGEFDLGYRLQARVGSLVFILPATTLAEMYNLRNSILTVFQPGVDLKLKWELPNGVTRQIDGKVAGELSMPWEPKRWGAQRLAVQIRCAEPAFYDPDLVVVNITGLAGGTAFDVPMAIPWTIGGATINSSYVINYPGNWLSYPQIRITGPITDPVITNNSTGEVLSFLGYTISAGTYYDIDTRPGYKTVTDSAGANQISKLATNSDLSTWHLAPDPEAPGGVNSIQVAGSSGSTATKISLSYYVRYLGI